MAILTKPTREWCDAIAAPSDGIIQTKGGSLLITETADPDDTDGIELAAGEGVRVTEGQTVRYKLADHSTAIVVFEGFGA